MNLNSQKIIFLLMSFLLVSASHAGDPRLDGCHMGSCSWSKTLSKKEIASDERGRLILLKLLGGSNQDDSSESESNIIWNESPHEVYIFCSTRLPAVMMKSREEIQVEVLDFWQGIPGAYVSSANLYREICHLGSETLSDEELANKFKYSPSPEPDITISNPTEIFGYVNKKSTSPSGESPFECVAKFVSQFNLTMINCSIVADKVEITNTTINRGKCNNTESTPLNQLFVLGAKMQGYGDIKSYEDFYKKSGSETSSEMGEYGFSDIFSIVTDCSNIIEWTIETDREIWTFKRNR